MRNFLRPLVLILGLAAPFAAADDAPGWVLVAIEVVKPDGEHYDPTERDVMGGFTIKHLDSDRVYRSITPRYIFELFEVKPGTYCVHSIRTYANQDLPLCDARDPFTDDKGKRSFVARFKVDSGELVNLGFWKVVVSYDVARNKVSYRLIDSFARQRTLAAVAAEKADAEMVARARNAHPQATAPDALTTGFWYHLDSQTALENLQFAPNGDFRAHEMNAKGAGTAGRWRREGDELVIDYGSYATVRARWVDGELRGRQRMNSNGMWVEWAAGRDPFQPAGFKSGAEPRIVGARRLDLPQGVTLPIPAGRVVARINLPPSDPTRLGYRAVWVSHVAEILSPDASELHVRLVKDIVRTRIYTPAIVEGVSVEKAWDETFEFPQALDAVEIAPPKKR